MKKTLLPALLLALALLCACGGNTVIAADASLEDISAELQGEFAPTDVTVLNSEYMLLLYGLDAKDCAEVTAFRVVQAITPSEIILVRAADAEAQKTINETLEAYLRQLRDTTREYDAESYAIAEKSRVYTGGLYSALIYDERQSELEALFTAHLKEYAPEEAPVFTPAPTAAPTPAPTAEPVPEPEAEEVPLVKERPPYGLLPESERAEDSWFDDALFVGNSVLGNLKAYVISQRMGEEPNCMGKAVFMNVNTISYASSVGEIHAKALPLSLDGLGNCTIEEAVAYTGARKVFLTMGYGDLVYYPNDIPYTMKNVAELVRRIREANGEDMEIYLVSVTPRTANFDGQQVNQARFDAFNAALLEFASDSENRCWYINAAEPLKDETGHLKEEYCMDMYKEGIHLHPEGCRIWVDTFYTHTA